MKYYTLLAIMTLLSCQSIKPIAFERTGEVVCLKYDASTITVESTGRANEIGQASYFAERNAFENILFKGIPNSNQKIAMIPDEIKFKDSNSIALDQFLNQDFARFIISSKPINSFNNHHLIISNLEITIDLDGLRSYLEQNKWVRKFGL